MNKIDFKTIIPAAKAGDKAARDRLMEAFYAWSISRAKRIIRDQEDAKNVAVSFWEWLFTEGGIGSYDPERGGFYSWMQMRIQAMCVDKTRLGRIITCYTDDESTFDLEQASTPESMLQGRQTIQEIADRLPPDCADLFWRRLEGATIQELVEETGESEGRVHKKIVYIRQVIAEVTGE